MQRLLHWIPHHSLFQSRTLPWAVFGSVGLVISSMIVLATYTIVIDMKKLQRLNASAGHMSQAVVTGSKDGNAGLLKCKSNADFAQHFPASPQVRDVLAEIERSTSANGVTFGGIQRQDRADAGQLGRTDLTVAFLGSYPAVKSVTTDLLMRFGNITLSQWHLRRGGRPAEVESTVTLAVWSAPLPLLPATLDAC